MERVDMRTTPFQLRPIVSTYHCPKVEKMLAIELRLFAGCRTRRARHGTIHVDTNVFCPNVISLTLLIADFVVYTVV